MATLQAILNGLLVGGIYALIAMGMALVFGVMRLVNFAHASFLMVGMYLAYFGYTLFKINPYWGFVLVGGALAVIGLGVYFLLIRRVMGQSDFLQILLTEGVSLCLIGTAQLLFTGDYRSINLPLANQTATLGGLNFNVAYAVSFAIAIFGATCMYLYMRYTEMGRAIRAVAQNQTVAPLMGIRVAWVSGISFAFGVACAGAAGALLLPIFYVNPTVGGPYNLKSFVIVVLGGMGSLEGAALGGLILGVTEGLTAYYWEDSYTQVVDFILFLAVLLLRPQGLFGRKAP
ncbi:MAG TPA: branched-chain amino acid ABC transporter permease [Myxococcaceae bacterium]|nr:branched-chain amino acid ABC transporter permease [Myxococcaceae bacterium]